MTIDLAQLFLLGLLTSSLHWLVARSEIARPLWSRTSGWFARLLACAGCSGFWLGAYVGGMMIPVVTLPMPSTTEQTVVWWIARFLMPGLLGVFVTPVFEGVLLWGLHASAIAEPPDDVIDSPGPVPQAVPPVDSHSYDTPVSNPLRRKTRP